MSATEPPRAAPLHLWRIAQAFLNTLYNLFGAPEDVAASHTLTAKAHNLLADWLRAGEALLRRLLLIEAAALAPALVPPASSRQGRKRQRKLIEFSADKPEEWRVTFRCHEARAALRQAQGSTSDSGLGLSKTSTTRATSRFRSAWPLAERYEALLRVFNAPFAFAKRIARRLRQLVKNVAALFKHPPNAPDLVGHLDFADVHSATAEALRRFDTS